MGPRPAIVCLTGSGLALAEQMAGALDADVHGKAGRADAASVTFDDTMAHIGDLFLSGRPIIGLCAAGILIRAVAPFLADKTGEPPVIAVSESDHHVVPLLGGHHGANRLAGLISQAIDGAAIISTAGDAAFGVALDEPGPGWILQNPQDAKPVMAALLAGGGARIEGSLPFENQSSLPLGKDVNLIASDKPIVGDQKTLVYHPTTYCLGVGASRNCPARELIDLAETGLREANIAPGALAGVFSIDVKMDEVAVNAVADHFGIPLRFFTAAELEKQTDRLSNPSDIVFAEVGCHGVCEGAALAGAGEGSELVVPKQKSAMATIAISQAPMPLADVAGRRRGHLAIVGIGPGDAGMRTPDATRAIYAADELVGYSLYIDLLGPLAAKKSAKAFPLGDEEARCRYALERAGEGERIALVCSGDPGIYAMAALVFELLDRDESNGGVSAAARLSDVQVVPGVSAMQSAAARLGAPLGHDFCAISLSDLLTPRAAILQRLEAAAAGDFVISFYNPVSRTRRDLLEIGRQILLRHRPASTPVALGVNLGRPEEVIHHRTLATLSVDEVDMLTTVVVGSSQSRAIDMGGTTRLYTPRGYAKRIEKGAA